MARRRYGSAGRTPCHIRPPPWPKDQPSRQTRVLGFAPPSPRGEGGVWGRRALPGPLSSGCGRSHKRISRGGPETAQTNATQGGPGRACRPRASPVKPVRAYGQSSFQVLESRRGAGVAPPTPTLLGVVEAGLKAHGAGEVVLPPKSHIHLDDRFNGHFNVLPGFVAPVGAAGVKVVGDYVDNYRVGLPSE